VEDGHRGLELLRSADEFHRPLRTTLLERNHAEQVRGIGVRGFAVEEALVDPRRFLQKAPMVIVEYGAEIILHA
jgi:hypothetical protein